MLRWLFSAMAVLVFLAGLAMLAGGLRLNGTVTLGLATLFGLASDLIARNRVTADCSVRSNLAARTGRLA
jgi:hypothetical protein